VGAYVVRRLIIAAPLLVAITIANFLLINLAPGDPIDYLVNPEVGRGPEELEVLRSEYGLDQPLPVRYVKWMKEVLQGNLGWRMSLEDPRPVRDVLLERLPRTIQLMLVSIVISCSIGVLLGTIAAVRQYSRLDYALTLFAFVSISVPSFFVALVLIYLFAARFGWFPTSGVRSPGAGRDVIDQLRHLLLPATALAAQFVAITLRQTRASLLEVLSQDYIVTARAKGLRESIVVSRHAFRNALMPIITLFGLFIPEVIGGSIIIETIFQWPGIGSLTIDAVNGRDYNTLMAILLMGSVMVLFSNLVVDIVYAYVDPRIRFN
jgi:peptide/nickel transport system permease protein